MNLPFRRKPKVDPVEVALAFERGYLAGRVMRQRGDRLPTWRPVDDPESDAARRGVQKGWKDMDREIMRAYQPGWADGVEDVVEEWKAAG